MAETATELRAQLAKVGEDEAVLQAKLQLLAEERQSILRKLGTVVYPVLTLPSDITTEVFMHCLDNRVFIYNCPLKAYPPLLLASVCRTWRKVALAFPRLCASFRLHWHVLNVVRREPLLQYWLPHAGSCPIDLELSGWDLTPSMCDTVAKYAPQLRSLALSAQSASQFSLAAQQSQRCFAALRKLAVEFESEFGGTAITAFTEAPQLRELHITRGSISFINLPWDQLTTLHLEDILEREVLNQTPNLEVLSFYDTLTLDSDSEDDEQTLVPLVMTKLHTLKIDADSSSNWHFLDHLTLPALRTLEFGHRPHIVSTLRALVDDGLHIHIEWAAGEPSKSVNPELVRFLVFYFSFRLLELTQFLDVVRYSFVSACNRSIMCIVRD
ncbi:hypothetical protein C8J57DRAFT_1602471 [Mycena rebaudengoi]|nr:hypothetical protein C8J57DRAFT_1602471 [Mycena rebaudengoi]